MLLIKYKSQKSPNSTQNKHPFKLWQTIAQRFLHYSSQERQFYLLELKSLLEPYYKTYKNNEIALLE